LKENNRITIISNGRSLELLKTEIGDKAKYVDISDYPQLLSENSRQFMAKSLVYWPLFIKRIESGLIKLSDILKQKKFDLIISDARYDIYSKKIPTIFISHQMRIMNPLRIKMFETGSELFNLFFFKRFAGVVVPDYLENDLSGDLSHNLKKISEKNIHYIGALSDFKKIKLKKDIDYLISLSGPEPQRTILEQKLLSQTRYLDGRVVITLGKTEEQLKIENKNVTTYSYLTKEKREELLNRSKIIISRSGYSTIMDLAVINSKALLIPTPGQIEQIYLAEYHKNKNTFYSINQQDVNLEKNLKEIKATKGIIRKCDVKETVENFMKIVYSLT
jgi:uncharacterized protein (TIGR00661 family)